MAYNNNNNNNNNGADFHSIFSSSNDFDAYPFLNQTSADEQANYLTQDTFADCWGMDRQPDYAVGSSRSLRAEPDFGSESLFTPYAAPTHDHRQGSFPEHYWPVSGLYGQSYNSGIVGRDDPFASTVAQDVSAAAPIPSSTPLHYWGTNESGLPTSTFYANVQTPHQPDTDSIRMGLMPTRRFQPYGTPRARLSEHTNAVAGPSVLAAPPTAHPSGGQSEATANAADQTTVEEDTAPAARRPRGTGLPRGWRIRGQREVHRLRLWAQGWANLSRVPSHERALEIALGVIKTIREPVYPEPRLFKGHGKRTAEGNKGADSEHRRRKGTRWYNEQLSRYYQLPANRRWACPALVLKVLEDLEGLPKPPVPPPP